MKKSMLVLITILLLVGCSDKQTAQKQQNQSSDLPYTLVSGDEKIELEDSTTVSSKMIVDSVVAREMTPDENYDWAVKLGKSPSINLGEDNLIVEVIYSDVLLLGEYVLMYKQFTPQIWNNNEKTFSITESIVLQEQEGIYHEGSTIGENYKFLTYQYLVPKDSIQKNSQLKLMNNVFFDIKGVD